MEYLDMTFSEEDKKPKEGHLELLIKVSDLGLPSKEPVDLDKLTSDLTEAESSLFETIMKSKSDGQDKAIVSALFSKYPKLDKEVAEVNEFKDHISNMIDSDVLTIGSMKFLIEKLLSGNPLDKKPKVKQPEEPQQPEAEPQESEANQSSEQESQEGTQSVDTNNSDMLDMDNLIDNWEANFSDNCELSEDDFSDILGTSIEDLRFPELETVKSEDALSKFQTSEMRKKALAKLNPAREFIAAKMKSGSHNAEYSFMDGLSRATTFLIKKEIEFSEYDKDLEERNTPKYGVNRKFLDKSEVTKNEMGDIDRNDKLYKFFNEKYKVKSNDFKVDNIYHNGAGSLISQSAPLRSHEGDMTDGVEIIKMKNRGRKELATDVRGNLITRSIEKPDFR